MKDVLIIGGGIAGISAAARLAPHANVVLLEAEDTLAHHASGRSAALYEPRYGLPSTVALSMASSQFYLQENPHYLSDRGLLFVGRTEDLELFNHDLQNFDLEQISTPRAIELVPILNPDAVACAAYHPGAWDLDTDLIIQDFAKTCRAAGGRIHTKAQVNSVTKDAATARWQIDSTAGQFSADILVNAAGAWVDEIARMAGVQPLGFTPCRRSMARIPSPGGLDPSPWPMVIGVGERWYCKPDAGQLIVSPAEEDIVEPHDAWADDMVLAEGLARYEEMVTEPVTRLTASWAGLRTFSPDRALTIGFARDDDSFFWLAGQGGYGFQTAPAASQLAADLITGQPPVIEPELVAQLDPSRFD